MNGDRFDKLTRRFSTLLNRRRFLVFSVAGVATVAQPAAARATQASCEPATPCPSDTGTSCFANTTMAGECVCLKSVMFMVCSKGNPCIADQDCGIGAVCSQELCVDGFGRCMQLCTGHAASPTCEEGLTLCDGQCRDLTADVYHCGACGHQCVLRDEYGEICTAGQCACPPEMTGACGQDYCTNEQIDWNNCGACGNQCVQGETCCDGRCTARESAERFCDGCGYLAGWPQGCFDYETCAGGLCVANGEFELQIVAVICPEYPQIYEIPPVDGPFDLVDLLIQEGCRADEGNTVEARGQDGRLTGSCVTSRGVCSILGSFADLPLSITQTGLGPDVTPDVFNLSSNSESLTGPTKIVPLISISGATEAEVPASSDSEVLQPTGDLAYAVKNGDHWDIWVYSFDSLQNTQTASVSNSDQWAPSYSHDGSRLAYLSDETDGSNQIWVMDPDGSNKRQITDWHGAESILYVAWAPDDSQLVVTLFGEQRRLVTMPASGGDFADFVGLSTSFATTSRNGILVYAADDGTSATSISLANFDDPPGETYAEGDTPNLTQDGNYVAVQIGDPGSRRIETYTIKVPGHALPTVPRVGDDSNPVWIVTDHAHLAFVSAGPDGETIQICRLWNDYTTPIEIAPHDRVWYLSKRFVP